MRMTDYPGLSFLGLWYEYKLDNRFLIWINVWENDYSIFAWDTYDCEILHLS